MKLYFDFDFIFNRLLFDEAARSQYFLQKNQKQKPVTNEVFDRLALTFDVHSANGGSANHRKL